MSRRIGILAAIAGSLLLTGVVLVAPRAATPIQFRSGPDAPGPVGGTGAPADIPATGATAGNGRGRPDVRAEVHHDSSVALRSIEPRPPQQGEQDPDAETPLSLPGRPGSAPAGGLDPALQSPVGSGIAATVVRTFDGVSNVNGVLPPDTNGDIGPNDYVQWVNLSFAVYSRSGALLYGPAAGSTLWTGFGAPCETTNDGDPIAQYDQLADRWVMSQFALPNYPSGPFYMCVAVSQTGDPLGAWNRYAFKISDTKFDDYPHLTVWPDGYYLSINQFDGNTWGGAGAVAFERSKMLAGQSARMVYFDLFNTDPNLGGMQPSDLDGPAPPAGAPNVYAEADDDANGYAQDQLDLWDFHVDWTTPSSSTFTHDVSLATAPMDTNLCGYKRDCIPQPQPKHGKAIPGLDALADRIMYRLQYRNFGSYQTLVTNQTVDTNGADRAGIRWFEVRNSGSGWAIRQQGTWSPDATDRWLGSAAMNGNGDIGLGYSVSSTSVFPSIRFAGRLAADPLGTLTTTEATLQAGAGTQSDPQARWGDYSMLAVDPTDGCTFWYTNEYMATSGDAPWLTRIAEVRLPGCGGGGDLTPPAVSSFAPTTTSPTNAATISYGLGFSESVTGLASGDFTRTGTATGCGSPTPSGSGASYTVTITGCGTGTVILGLNANTVADLAANLGPTASATAATVTVDRTAPTATVTAPASPTGASTLTFGVGFSEAVTGLAAADFATAGTATGCSVGAPSGSGATYTVGVSACSEGTVSLTLHAGTVADAVSNAGPPTAVTSATVTIDRSGPTASVTAPASPTSAAGLSFGVSFSTSVTGLAAADFATSGTATGCSIGAPSGSGSSYTVAVSGCSGGTVTLTLHAGAVLDSLSDPGPATDVSSASVTIDRTAPTVTAPAATIRSGVQLSGTTFALALGWVAADSGGAGLTTCDVWRSADGAAFAQILTGVACGPASVANVGATSGHSYRFEVRAHDAAGNVGAFLAGPTLKPTLYQQTSTSIGYHGTWTTSTYASYSAGTVKYATGAGAYATFTFTGRGVAFVTTRAASRGSVKVYVDGVLVTTVSCYAASTTFRWVGFARTWATSGTHTLKFVVVGTAGHPRVDLDAIEVLR